MTAQGAIGPTSFSGRFAPLQRGYFSKPLGRVFCLWRDGTPARGQFFYVMRCRKNAAAYEFLKKNIEFFLNIVLFITVPCRNRCNQTRKNWVS